ncbi:hypothetical protein DM01DRAFT_1338464 [Hesseltinella vesiculosa]|uniref:Ribonucleases P/MRP subunit Pop8-like domain-containing protein n=1 Tax=Hesseltinella vesiculosa TaxID=101127 RepID=A0A1X2GB46_9FUNG|nr:hypothetical protein DM01DRAFT_1338464 [Hesseltinella vesiculosa]
MTSHPFSRRFRLEQWHYIKLKILSESPLPTSINDVVFRMSIHQAMMDTLGVVGAGIKLEVIDWDEKEHTGIIKAPQSELISVWGALVTHEFSLASQPCVFDILSSSSQLLSLAV